MFAQQISATISYRSEFKLQTLLNFPLAICFFQNVPKYIIISFQQFDISSSIVELKTFLAERARNKTCWETEEGSDYDRVAWRCPPPLSLAADGVGEIPAQCGKAHRVGGGGVTSICCGFCCSCTCRESRHVSYACDGTADWGGGREQGERGRAQGQGRRMLDKFGKIATATGESGADDDD